MKALRGLFRFLRPYWLPALAAPLCMALEVAMDLAQPRFLQRIVDEGIAAGDSAFVLRTGGIMLAAGFIGLLAGGGCGILATIAGLGFGTDLRGLVFGKIQSLSAGNLDRLETGKLITRLTSDVDQVQEAAMMLMRILVRAPLLAAGGLVMAIITAPKLTWILLVISPVILALLAWVTWRGHDLFLALQERLDRVNAVLQENLAGVRVVRAFLRAERERRRFAESNDALMGANVRANGLMAGIGPLLGLLLNIGVVGVLWFGGRQAIAGEAQVGQLLAFTSYLSQMLFSLMMVGMLVVGLARADASAQRIEEVLAAVPDVADPEAPVALPPARGRVEFEDVRFSYGGEDAEPVLRGVSFVAEPGEMVAILGATGSGKSSLVHLVPRLYDVTGGRVLLDGVDVREARQSEVRERVALVMQEAVLFSGSVRDNVRYGRPEATEAEAESAAEAAQALDFVRGLSEGWETALGQRGVNLSGGQKQRLALARALARKPSVLVLDDCTSALDAETEHRVMDAIAAPSVGCTRLVVAQRVGSVVRADRIVVLEDGVVAAQGTHAELVASSPIYRDIIASQLDASVVEGGEGRG